MTFLISILTSVVILVILVPVCQVVLTRHGPITRTPLMQRRLREAKMSNRTNFNIDVRWVNIENISPELLKAAIAVEDHLFLVHHGFSLHGLRLAISELIHTGRITNGHSTITNQTARNVFLTLRKHYWRKALEYYYSILMELIWGKRRIMEVYLNIIEMGDGIFGCEAAAFHHFSKHAIDLGLHESILLCVSLRNPRRFTPRLFQSETGWWNDHINSCEWLAEYWKAADGKNIWELHGKDRICLEMIMWASDIAERLSQIAKEGQPIGPLMELLHARGLPRLTNDALIEACREKSADFSTLNVGELVWREKHVGLYVGDGLTVELPSQDRDIPIFTRGEWMGHGKLPFFDYSPVIRPA